MKGIKFRLSAWPAISFLLVLLFSIFNFTTLPNATFFSYQEESDVIIQKTLVCQKEHGSGFLGGNMVLPKDGSHFMQTMKDTACPAGSVQPYASQFGLQTKITGFLYGLGHIGINKFMGFMHILSALSFALVISWFLWFVKKEFGLFSASATLLLILVSQWMLLMGKSVYWQEALLFAPFIFTLTCYPWATRSKRNTLWFFAGLGGLVLIKSLNGYEFLSTIAASAGIAVLYHEFMAHQKLDRVFLKTITYKAAWVLSASVVGFVFALGLHFMQLNNYYHDAGKTISAIAARVKDRTTAGDAHYYYDALYNFEVSSPDIYSQLSYGIDFDLLKQQAHDNPQQIGLKVELLSALNYLTLPVLRSPVSVAPLLNALLGSFLVVAAAGTYAALRAYRQAVRTGQAKKERALAVAFLVSFVAPLSWLVLSRGHAIVHPHINGILFYIPTMLLGYMLIGVHLQKCKNVALNKVNKGK